MDKNKFLFFLVLIVGLGIVFIAISQAYSIGRVVASGCVDSDGGLNYNTYGYVTYNGVKYYDTCKTTTVLREAYCSALGKVASKDYTCSEGCASGACKVKCIPATCSSLGKQCGSWSDGCGGTLNCGSCPTGQVCDSNGQCVACTPNCAGKECGDDGCGGSCGTCQTGETCSNGVCKALTGFVGCSISHNAVDGYFLVGGDSFWVTTREEGTYSGGSIDAWHKELVRGSGLTNYWGIFQNYSNKNPGTSRIWWELCSSGQTANLTYENVVAVLDEIKRRAPGIEIYATPMPIFPDTTEGVCVDNNGPQIVAGFTDRMIQEGKVIAGPIMTPLVSSQTQPDGCHANLEGQQIWGTDLLNFFGP